MTDFFVKVMIGAIKVLLQDKDFTAWVDARLAGVEANIKADLENIEDNVIKSLEALPAKIVGDAESDVKSLLGVVPGQVKDQVSPLFDGFSNLLKNFNIQIPGIGSLFPWGNK
jgi:hypothetical protein